MEFLETLRIRKERAGERVRSLRRSLAEAEEELKFWTKAVALEERPNTQPADQSNVETEAREGARPNLESQKVSLNPEDTLSKRGVLLGYLRSLDRPIPGGELTRLVEPVMSRASMYLALRLLEAEGLARKDEKKRYYLTRTNDKEAPSVEKTH